ncbi:MAG: hypothetical protein WBY67_15540, partial [Pseudolabrys sp.]
TLLVSVPCSSHNELKAKQKNEIARVAAGLFHVAYVARLSFCFNGSRSLPKPPCNMTATYVLVIDVGAYYGVSRSYIFRCLKEIAPERRRQMVQSIIVLCFWPEMMARMQILAGRID